MTESEVETMLAACLPGGSQCAPQQVADSIRAWMAQHQGPTGGSPEHMLQDQDRGLSQWLASQPDARLHAREAAAAINPWRDAVIAELDSAHLTTAELEADPRAALRAVIDWNQRIALDPLVSSDARALVDRGRAEMTPADPLDMRLPCDIRIGHGTHGKGTPLRTLVTRMRLLYDMAQEVVSRSMQAASHPPARVALTDCGHESCDCRGYCKRGITGTEGGSNG